MRSLRKSHIEPVKTETELSDTVTAALTWVHHQSDRLHPCAARQSDLPPAAEGTARGPAAALHVPVHGPRRRELQ